ncbi:MAG TPA: hypothetical protein DHU74_06360 [Clostridiales bacterium]|nr:hypothetical protein [Clostridiales bacterium]
MWRFLSPNLADLGTVKVETCDGYFSYDAKSYYFLRDDVLCRAELESGETQAVKLDYDLRFLDIAAFDASGSRMLAHFYLSPYSSKCGSAIFDPVTGEFSMLCAERYQAVFSGADVCLMEFDENTMGYSVLFGADDGGFFFADAGIFLDGSSEIYGICASPYLMGTSSEVSTLYSVGQKVRSCSLSSVGISGAIYSACYLLDEGVLVGSVYENGAFSLYVIYTGGLEFQDIADAAVVASPLTVNDELAQAYIGEKSGGEVAQTLSQARQQADALGEKYGVQILLSSQCAGAAAQCDYDIALTDTMDSREELGSINAALKSIERCLALYPDGFFAQLKNSTGEGGVRFLLVEEIKSGFGTSGCTYERGAWQNIALDIRLAYELDGIVCHELWHATENHILSCDYSLFTVEGWAQLNPQSFSYYEGYDYSDPDSRRWTYYSGGDEGVYFVDGYSRTFASEDRARIMEFFMTRDDDAQELIKSPAIKKKLQHMSSAVRSVFDTSGWESVRWERLL